MKNNKTYKPYKPSPLKTRYSTPMALACPSLSPSSHIFYKIIHTDSTSVNVLLINIFESRRERGKI